MRISTLALLLFAMVGCGSGTEPGKTPAKAVDDQAQDVPEQPAKPDAESDGNQAQPQNPVEQVSWNDAVEFCRKLSALPAEKSGGYVYRLPTEAEWEYSCRPGTTTKYSFGNSDAQLGDYAWFGNNSGDKQIDALKIWETDQDNYGERILGNNCRTHPVGSKKPNAGGLYDMHGNVYKWCQDWYGDYPSGSTTDPTGAASGSFRVNRGTSIPSSVVRRSATGSRLTPGATSWAFVCSAVPSSKVAGGGIK